MTPSSSSRPAPTLVVGGAGFIGSHVVEALLARGGVVRVLDDLSSGRATNLPLHDPNLELCVGDILDPDCVRNALDGMSWCVHLAAEPVRPAHDPYQSALSNILGFVNVIDAMHACGIARLVYASSAAVYGETHGPLTEDAEAKPCGPRGMEKLVAESYADLYARQHGVQALGLRYFSVYGPRQDTRRSRAGVVTALLERLGDRRPALLYGDGRQARDFIHVEDAAAATVAALFSDACGVCNVGTGLATELRELVQLLGYALDQKPLMHFLPARRGDGPHGGADTRRMQQVLALPPPRTLRAGLSALVSDWASRRRIDRSRLPRAGAPRVVPRSGRASPAAGRTLQ